MEELQDPSSKSVKLLLKEAGLTATCIKQGLTSLRKANFVEKGYYYQAFFLLSIGIERLLKLTVIAIKLTEENKFPTNESLRKDFGHNIEKLIQKTIENINPNNSILKDDIIYEQIITFLTEYAKSARYYNLDSLTGGVANEDPLHSWQKIQSIIKVRHIKEWPLTQSDKLYFQIINNNSTFLFTNEVDKPLENASDYFIESALVEKLQGFSVYYFHRLISFLVNNLVLVSERKHMLPTYHEFFPLFLNRSMTKAEIMRRKNWNI